MACDKMPLMPYGATLHLVYEMNTPTVLPCGKSSQAVAASSLRQHDADGDETGVFDAGIAARAARRHASMPFTS